MLVEERSKKEETSYLKTGCELMMEQEAAATSPDSEMRSHLPEEPNVGSDAKTRSERRGGRDRSLRKHLVKSTKVPVAALMSAWGFYVSE